MPGENRWRYPPRLAQQRRFRWHADYAAACLDGRLMLRQRRVLHWLKVGLTAVIAAVIFALGAILNQASTGADQLSGQDSPPRLANAYNDRAGRLVVPHTRWQGRGHRWQSPHPDLWLFAAHYRHEPGSSSKPYIRVTALATANFLRSCSVQARVVYWDYPHSFPSDTVFCRPLSRSPADAPVANATLFDVILKFTTGQPAERVPVAVSIKPGSNRSSVAWIAVNTVFVKPPEYSIAVCLRVDNGADLKRVAELVTFYRLEGARQITVYVSTEACDSAAKSPLGAQLVLPWYDRRALRQVSDRASLSLMLRDCALRSPPSAPCLAFLSSAEKLIFLSVNSTRKGFFKDRSLLNLCVGSQLLSVKRRDFFHGSCSIDIRLPLRLRRCSGGLPQKATFFRTDDALLDGPLSAKKARVLPLSTAFLRPLTFRAIEAVSNNATTPDIVF